MICLKGDQKILDADENALRHELEHFHDSQRNKMSGVINGIDTDEIIQKNSFTSMICSPILELCKYLEEFINAGIGGNKWLLSYAYTSIREFKAVAAQGVCSKYSEGFKKILVQLGFPECIFKLKPNNQDFIKEANYIADLRQKYPQINIVEEWLDDKI